MERKDLKWLSNPVLANTSTKKNVMETNVFTIRPKAQTTPLNGDVVCVERRVKAMNRNACLKSHEKRIKREMGVLRRHRKNPDVIPAYAADFILRTSRHNKIN